MTQPPVKTVSRRPRRRDTLFTGKVTNGRKAPRASRAAAFHGQPCSARLPDEDPRRGTSGHASAAGRRIRRDAAVFRRERHRGRTLTPLQSETLKGIAEGKPIKVIAKELGIAPRIVERHRADLKRRFDLKQSRGDASIRAQVVRKECLGLGVASEPEADCLARQLRRTATSTCRQRIAGALPCERFRPLVTMRSGSAPGLGAEVAAIQRARILPPVEETVPDHW